jgi:hypothetical protein
MGGLSMVPKRRRPLDTSPSYSGAKALYFQAALPAVLPTLAAGEGRVFRVFRHSNRSATAGMVMLREIREADCRPDENGSPDC